MLRQELLLNIHDLTGSLEVLFDLHSSHHLQLESVLHLADIFKECMDVLGLACLANELVVGVAKVGLCHEVD